MNNNRRLWIIIVTGIIITVIIGLLALSIMLNCCKPPSTFLVGGTRGPEVNKAVELLVQQTETAAVEISLSLTAAPIQRITTTPTATGTFTPSAAS